MGSAPSAIRRRRNHVGSSPSWQLGYGVAMLRHSLGRLVAIAALAGACACASLRPRSDAQRLAELLTEVRAQGVSIADPLWLAPEVLSSVEQQIGPRGSALQRLLRLSDWLSDSDGLGFRYDALKTRTASEAWSARSGDCLSYAHLFNALARHLELPMMYVRYRSPRGYEERDGQFVVISHVASLYERDRDSILVELSNEDFDPHRSDYERLRDDQAAALHVSNLAMQRLGPDEINNTERLLRVLVAHDPELAELHNNLGAVLLRNHRYQEALRVLQQAIHRFPSVVSLYVNASLAAKAAGNLALADQLAATANEPWTDPFIPFTKAARLFESEQLAEAVQLFERVVKLNPRSATFQAWLARGLAATGKITKARAAWQRARELDPRHPMLESLRVSLQIPSPS
jgi:Tfp pilus assembly protein PilF